MAKIATASKGLSSAPIALAALILSGCATVPQERVLSGWIISAEYDQEPTGSARNGELLFSQKIVPIGLAATTVELKTPDFVVPIDAQFYRVVSANGAMYCSVRQIDDLSSDEPDFSNGSPHVCVADDDADLIADRYITARSSVLGMPIINQIPVAEEWLAADIPLTSLSPGAMQDVFVVGLEHDGKPMLRNDRRIMVKFGQPEHLNQLTMPELVANESLPEDLKVLGGIVRVTGLTGDDLAFEVVKKIPMQPFSVGVRTIRY